MNFIQEYFKPFSNRSRITKSCNNDVKVGFKYFKRFRIKGSDKTKSNNHNLKRKPDGNESKSEKENSLNKNTVTNDSRQYEYRPTIKSLFYACFGFKSSKDNCNTEIEHTIETIEQNSISNLTEDSKFKSEENSNFEISNQINVNSNHNTSFSSCSQTNHLQEPTTKVLDSDSPCHSTISSSNHFATDSKICGGSKIEKYAVLCRSKSDTKTTSASQNSTKHSCSDTINDSVSNGKTDSRKVDDRQYLQLMTRNGSLRNYSRATLTPIDSTEIWDHDKIEEHLALFSSDYTSLSSGSDNVFIEEKIPTEIKQNRIGDDPMRRISDKSSKGLHYYSEIVNGSTVVSLEEKEINPDYERFSKEISISDQNSNIHNKCLDYIGGLPQNFVFPYTHLSNEKNLESNSNVFQSTSNAYFPENISDNSIFKTQQFSTNVKSDVVSEENFKSLRRPHKRINLKENHHVTFDAIINSSIKREKMNKPKRRASNKYKQPYINKYLSNTSHDQYYNNAQYNLESQADMNCCKDNCFESNFKPGFDGISNPQSFPMNFNCTASLSPQRFYPNYKLNENKALVSDQNNQFCKHICVNPRKTHCYRSGKKPAWKRYQKYGAANFGNGNLTYYPYIDGPLAGTLPSFCVNKHINPM